MNKHRSWKEFVDSSAPSFENPGSLSIRT